MRTLPFLVLFGAGLMTAFYAFLCAVLYFKQDAFLFPRAVNDPTLVGKYRTQRVLIPAGEIRIEGWWVENPAAENDVALLYFGGNAEDIIYLVDDAARLNARHLLAINYRGYGNTSGSPSQSAIFNDALAAYDYAIARPGVGPQNIVAMGRSLGSGVAVHVAAHRAVRGVILITPYDSMTSVAQAHYPYFPVRLLIRHPFLSIEAAAKIKAAVLVLAAENDAVVPAIHAKRLTDAWIGPKEIHVLADAAHNDIERHPLYYPYIKRFLADLSRPRT